jgi:hypothetical protein
MIRRLFTLVSALSQVLCVATCALWVRSYWAADVLGLVDGASGNPSLSSNWGAVVVGRRGTGPGDDRRLRQFSYAAHRQGFGVRRWSWLGFESSGVADDVYFAAPYWVFVILTSMLPATTALRTFLRNCRRSRALWPLSRLRLRPPRLARPLPGVRDGAGPPHPS